MTNRPPVRVGVSFPPTGPKSWHEQAVAAIRKDAHVHVRSVRLQPDVGSALQPDDGSAGRPDSDLDVMIDFTGIDVRHPPPFGVWRYGFGDGSVVADGAPGTIARLYRTTSDPGRAIVLAEGWFRARSSNAPGTPSVSARVAPWCARMLRRICENDIDALSAPAQSIDGCRDPEPPSQSPNAWDRAIVELSLLMRRERWTVGVLPHGIEEVLQRGRLQEPAWLKDEHRDRFYADPFPIRTDATGGTIRILAEEYRLRERRGRICELELSSDGQVRSIRDRIASTSHISYPFVFNDGGRTVCVPETACSNRVSAYAFDPARDEWRLETPLLDGFPVVDPTLVRRDGRWWLFCTNRDVENQTELHLFFAPDWRGPWQPHRFNPVKSDARSSRPAGAFFQLDGVLYRPSQNCSRRYGGGITINRVTEMSERRFREEPVLKLNPGPAWAWPDGLHTINAVDDVTLVDGLRVERRL